MIEKRCFLQWFVMTLACAVGVFFAWWNGLPQAIFQSDVTYMTSVIAAIFVAAVGYLGFASWRFDVSPFHWNSKRIGDTAHADIGLANWASAAVIYVGLIGTVIGLMLQLRALGAVDPSNPQSAMTFLGATVKALSTAFYATGCGLVAATLISALTQNLSYWLDRAEVS